MPTYTLVTDPAALARVTERIAASSGPVGLDTETLGLDPARGRVRLIQLTAGGNLVVIDLFAFPESRAALVSLFEVLASREITGHNLVGFDLPFLARLGFEPTKVFDCLIASRTVYAGEKGAHGLADCAERELGLKLDKGQQKSNWGAQNLSRNQLDYAAADVCSLIPLAEALRRRAAERKITATIELEMTCAVPVARMAAQGVSFDATGWCALADRAAERCEELVAEMDGMIPNPACLPGAEDWNWNSASDIKAALATVGVTVEDVEEETIAEVEHPIARALLEYKGASKLATAYGRAVVEKYVTAGRIYASWNQAGAKTGRMSCKSPNLQQVPRDPAYRRCFRARPGHVLVKCDYSQIELRVAAAVTGDRRMRRAYERGEDLHAITAAKFLGVELDAVTKEARQLAKPTNFGAIYGLGPRSLRRKAKAEHGKDMTDEQARGFLDAFFAQYPGVRAWHNRLKRDRSDAVWTRGGRRIAVEADQFYGAKANYVVQGTAGDGLKRAIVLLHDHRAECPTAELLLAVHDELVFEVPEGRVEEARAWVERGMIEAMRPLVDPIPVAVEVTPGPTWAGAETPAPTATPTRSAT